MLDDLTPLQAEIATILWSLGSAHECTLWLETLSPSLRAEALVVMELMLQAQIDEYVDSMYEYPDAEAIFEKIKNGI